MQDQMYIGAAYYPELWDKDEIEKDIARCKQAGVNVLRIGEFSWSELEQRGGISSRMAERRGRQAV